MRHFPRRISRSTSLNLREPRRNLVIQRRRRLVALADAEIEDKIDVTFGEDIDGVGGKAGMRVSW
jgi:hypothetical protein